MIGKQNCKLYFILTSLVLNHHKQLVILDRASLRLLHFPPKASALTKWISSPLAFFPLNLQVYRVLHTAMWFVHCEKKLLSWGESKMGSWASAWLTNMAYHACFLVLGYVYREGGPFFITLCIEGGPLSKVPYASSVPVCPSSCLLPPWPKPSCLMSLAQTPAHSLSFFLLWTSRTFFIYETW